MSMSQETMNIALPDNLKEYILRQASDGGYSSASEYVRELIRSDQKRKAQERLESLLLEGLESGEAREFTAEDWAELKRRVWQRDRPEEKK
jgi:antitoxin ParD1/3/4